MTACAVVVLRNGDVKRFTSHDADLVISGNAAAIVNGTYAARNSLSTSNFQGAADASVGNLSIRAFLQDPDVTEGQLFGGLYDRAEVYFFLTTWDDTSRGIIKLPRGWTGEVQVLRRQTVLEFRDLKQILQSPIGRTCKPMCDADLGDERCTVELAAFTFTGVVSASTSRASFSGSGSNPDTGYFKFGKITWTSGMNAGFANEIKAQGAQFGSPAEAAFDLFQPMPSAIQIGDEYEIVAGCNKIGRLGDCVGKFDNYINFQGFEDIPGVDEMLRTPDAP